MQPQRIYELLERLGNWMRAEERSAGAKHGLQPVQIHALSYLSRCNRYSDTPAGVTEYLGLTKGTASQSLKRLQEKGLIKARTDRDDGRVVHLAPTAKGRKLLASIAPPPLMKSALEQVAGDHSGGEWLEDLLRAVQQQHKGRSFGVCQSCRHFLRKGETSQCGLTLETLSTEDRTLICREHESPQ